MDTVALPICHLTLKVQRPPEEGYPQDLKTLGDHIKRRRLGLNLTQEQLAQKLKVHPQSISVWERDLKEPQTYLVPRIIEFLGYSPYVWPENLSDWIRICRRTNGLSQRKLAAKLGIDQSTVRGWEAGNHRPSQSSLSKIEAFIDSLPE